MDREERFARWLDEGARDDSDLPDVAARIKNRLADPASWDQPPDGLFDAVMGEISTSTPVGLQGRSDTPVEGEVVPIRHGAWGRALLGAAAVVVLIVAVGVGVSVTGGGERFVLAGTELAPEASAEVTLTDTLSGVEIELDVTGLEPAPPGFYYQAWVRNENGAVTIGTFHARGGGDGIVLWSGVDVADYPTITVTLQQEGDGAESSGQVVLKGSIED